MIPSALFTANLPLIERLLAAVCRRNGFPAAEAEEFASWAKLKLIDDDYAVLRKYQGRSTLPTYLTTVIANLFRDYRIHVWGKWRPSAEARHLGAVAVQLESLMVRDGRSMTEAVAHLRTNLKVELPPAEIESLAARLPQRSRRRFEGDDVLGVLPARETAESGVVDSEMRATERRTEAAIANALGALPAADRLILKLRYAEGMPIVDIAALLGEPPRPLYARIERTLGKLRRALENDGLSGASIGELVGWRALDLTIDYDRTSEDSRPGPSHSLERSN